MYHKTYRQIRLFVEFALRDRLFLVFAFLEYHQGSNNQPLKMRDWSVNQSKATLPCVCVCNCVSILKKVVCSYTFCSFTIIDRSFYKKSPCLVPIISSLNHPCLLKGLRLFQKFCLHQYSLKTC